MKLKLKQFITCLAIPLAVGAVSGFITRGSMEQFNQLNKPPLTPPGWVFPVVWTILYVLMGIASYLILTADYSRQRTKALLLYGFQLVVNFFWPIFFFHNGWYLFSFFWLVFLWCLVALTIRSFYKISETAACLLIPYLIWITFAGYLNLFIYLLN